MRLLRLLAVLAAGSTALTVMTAPAEAAAALTFAPGSLTFPAQDVGTTSAAQTITATNSGDQSVFFNNVSTTGNTLDFTIGTDDCIGTVLAPGASCSISVTFSPKATGTRTANVVYTDNAANSPQSVPLTGAGAGTNPSLTIDNQFFSCANGVCDIGAGRNVFVKNFFTTTFQASGGTAPYTWSGRPPAGLTLRPSGLLLGAPTTLGTQTFTATVTDAAGSSATGTFSLTVTPSPAPTPSGCQTGGKLKENLSGPSFNGRTPSGTANADESKFSGCGGFSLLSVNVSNVNLADGTQLWVTLDFGPVGVITLKSRTGTMPTYNMGQFGVSRDQIRVYSSLPDNGAFQQILIGGSFT
ncbi:choice-of-anchor D domain-containing protein [Jatrophihabitans sp.]|uniref:choice-of-anchor D domain-containing protein n=1 Tax=Jatrophihabitans sp. TaxID=1932789 RepID=UPI002CB5EF17|nr:choice-of-anchor D domain-containing protein [Jatrophihabitans sp.]